MSKRYEIEKITDILAIPAESIDDFLIDLKSYYQMGTGMAKLIDEVAATAGVRTKTVPQKMTWIDDNKHDVSVYITPKTKESEERNE